VRCSELVGMYVGGVGESVVPAGAGGVSRQPMTREDVTYCYSYVDMWGLGLGLGLGY